MQCLQICIPPVAVGMVSFAKTKRLLNSGGKKVLMLNFSSFLKSNIRISSENFGANYNRRVVQM